MQTGEDKNKTAEPTSYDLALEIIVKNPEMNATTFLNTLKSQGFILTKGTEADNSSSNAPSVRAGVKKESASFKFITTRLVEKDAKDDGIGPTKFKAILIQEGLGNLKDGFYYTKEALQSAVPIFEGKKIYADHPSSQEEQTRPERSVRDVLGHFENVKLEETEDGRAILTGEVKVLEGMQYAWARELMSNALAYSKKYPDKDFIGLSINASGEAEEIKMDEFLKENEVPESAMVKINQAKSEGLDTIRLVSKINDAVSCDLVTEAGAGGKVLQMIEKEKVMAKKTMKEDESKMNQEEAKDEQKPQDDATQDAELLKKLHSKLGGDQGMDEASAEMAKEALAMAKGKGLQGEEALKCAEYGMHMMKHMTAKKESDMKQAEEAKKEAEKKDCTKEAEVNKESASILELKGENAKLKEELHKIEVEKYLDKKLKESKLPMSVTKDFRESLGAVKSDKDIDRAFDLFMKGYKHRSESEGFEPLVLNVEKGSHLEESDSKEGLNLDGCLR